jgi:drug/metabolite transporter (DMT)-like permease
MPRAMEDAKPDGRRLSPKVLASLAAVYLIWSSTYFAIRIAVQSVPPFLTAGIRYLVAGLAMMAFAKLRGETIPEARTWARSGVVAVLFFVVGNGFVALASQHIGSGVVAVVCATMPLWAAVMMPMFGQRASMREWIGLGIGFVGVVVLGTGGDLRADRDATILLLLAPIGWALGSLLVKKLDVGRGAMGTAMQMITGGIATLLVSFARAEEIPTHVPTEAIVAIVYLMTFGSLVGLTAYNYLLNHARPALAMSYAYVNPVLAVLLGWLAGGEHVDARVAIAIGLILPAVIAIVQRPKPAPAPPPSEAAPEPTR